MKFIVLAISTAIAAVWVAAPQASAAEPHKPAALDRSSCQTSPRITEAAERRAGGALYKRSKNAKPGSAMKHAGKGHKMQRPHMVHKPMHGGSFFMVNNKIHHIEIAYSRECGLRLFFYNAFTQPISARRFRAFVLAVPYGDDGPPEVIRFLTPSPDGSILQAKVGGNLKLPLKISLHVKFPESDAPKLFNAIIRTETR